MNATSIRRAASFAAFGILCALAPPVLAQKAVIVVRHAEKVDESTDPLLSAAGTARAESLARTLKSLDIKGVYVTQFQRTALTAAPLAKALGLTVTVVKAEAPPELVERMTREHPRDVVLAVGHSNTVPMILSALGHAEIVKLGSDEFDSLFVVVPQSSGPPTVLRLRY